MAKQEVKLYGGDVVLTFEPGRHRYAVTIPKQKIVNQKVPSVTAITGMLDKPALVQWAANMCVTSLEQTIRPNTAYNEAQLAAYFNEARFNFRNVKKEAADIGTQAHEYLERHLNWLRGVGPAPDAPDDPQAALCVNAGKAWLSAHEVKIIETERVVYSLKLDMAGKFDKRMMIDGEHCIADWKTGKDIYPEQVLQVGTYAGMWEEEQVASGNGKKAKPIDAIWIVRLGKEDGDFEAVRFPRDVIECARKGIAGLRAAYDCMADLKARVEA